MSKMVIEYKGCSPVVEQLCDQCLTRVRKEDPTDGGQVSKRTERSSLNASLKWRITGKWTRGEDLTSKELHVQRQGGGGGLRYTEDSA